MGPGAAYLGRLLDFAQPTADDVCLDVAYGAGPIAAALRPRVSHIAAVDAGPRPDPRHPGLRAAPDTAPHALPPTTTLAPPRATRPIQTHPNLTHPNLTHPNLTHPNLTHPNLTRPNLAHPVQTRPNLTHPVQAGPVQASTLALPYRDRVFTLVTAQLALHSLADPLASVREMLRVCRPEGRLVVAGRVRTNAADAAGAARDRLERLRDPAHVGTPSLSQLTGLLTEAGANVSRLDVFVVERPTEPWLAGCDPAAAEQIRAALIAELDGGPCTGVRPRLIGGELWFTQSWAHIAAVPG